jgi:hypothetical protein
VTVCSRQMDIVAAQEGEGGGPTGFLARSA